MEKLIKEIQNLSILKVNTVYPIYQGEDVVYLHRSVSGYAIAIPFDDERSFDEKFVGITLSTSYLNYKDKSFKVLYLNMLDTGDLVKFSYIGSEFIDIENRKSLIANPYQWVDTWIEMFGDSKKKYRITDVLAELLALRYLFEVDKSAKWQGPNGGTHDIVLNDRVVEVKSSTNKMNTQIVISSRFQIDSSINENLFFVRLEPKPYQNTIDSVVKELICLGYDETELEELLTNIGYRKGNRARKISYGILSIDEYEINTNNFPVISLEQMNNLTISKNIIGFKLVIDLAAIESKKIK